MSVSFNNAALLQAAPAIKGAATKAIQSGAIRLDTAQNRFVSGPTTNQVRVTH